MKQDELITQTSILADVSKKDTESVIKALGSVIQAELKAGDQEVTLPGIGKFSVTERAARTGRNPATGEALAIAAKVVPHFSAAKALKDAVA